ncbi:MAG: hypothetical protein IJV82_00435 [Oscillospiraceae bacterium]|nr:hypothetical protein [Oscillospiraceae bacterium]
MSVRLTPRRNTGNSAQVIRIWALLFLLVGVAGRAIVENKILGMASMSFSQLNEALSSSGDAMIKATVGIVMKVVSACAVPLFVFLLVEGVSHTSSYQNYFLRVFGLAVVSEIPYDLAMHGKMFYWYEQNPVFGLVIAMFMLYLFKNYAGKSLKNVLVKVLVVVVATLWARMLWIAEGVPIVLILTAFWFPRKKRNIQILVGAVVTCLCVILPDGTSGTSIGSLKYLAAPMACLFIHRYNGEPDETSKLFRYAAYPVMLVICWLIGMFAF